MVVYCQSYMSEDNLNTTLCFPSIHPVTPHVDVLPHFNIISTFRLLFCLTISSPILFLAYSSTPSLDISSLQGHSWLFQLFSFLLSRRVSHCTENSKSISGFWSAWIFGVSGPRFPSSLYPLATPGKMWSTKLLKRAEWSLPCFLTRS